MSDKKTEDISFEEALSELQDIVRNIETGKDELEAVISNYERGNILKKHCEKKLTDAKLKIDKIIKNSDNNAVGLENGSDLR